MPFVKGQSGNPAGRPAGARNKFTRDMQEALEKSGLPLIQMIVDNAIDANPAAMRLCLDRLIGKHRPSRVELPAPDAPNYSVSALTEIHRALGAGEIASDEASRLVDFVGRTARVLASRAVAEIDFAHRLARCEEALLLLLNAGKPAARAESMPAEAPTAPAPQAPLHCNNNAQTMAPAADAGRPIAVTPPAGPAVAEDDDVAVADVFGEEPLPASPDGRRRVNGAAIERLMGSTSPLAHLAGAMAGKAAPAMPAKVPVEPIASA
ncbi:MAG TPA: DUF5681 domain-containing protein [Xanthobacteraceae bacterium]|nr:DUF5681 domain-containing protein [Xanthobacteraceae bacterium]